MDMDKEQWSNVYFSIMAIASVAVGAVSVGIGLLALQRSQAQTVGGLEPPTGVAVDVPRVRYSDSQVYVEVRNPGEWHELREFVQPNDPYLTHVIMGALSG
jgi:hypothetical protein